MSLIDKLRDGFKSRDFVFDKFLIFPLKQLQISLGPTLI